MVIRQPNQPIGDLVVLSIELALVKIEGIADAKRFTGNTNAHSSLYDRFLEHPIFYEMASPLFFQDLQNYLGLEFFLKAVFFKRRPYSSSSFICDIMDTSMPQYREEQQDVKKGDFVVLYLL